MESYNDKMNQLRLENRVLKDKLLQSVRTILKDKAFAISSTVEEINKEFERIKVYCGKVGYSLSDAGEINE